MRLFWLVLSSLLVLGGVLGWLTMTTGGFALFVLTVLTHQACVGVVTWMLLRPRA